MSETTEKSGVSSAVLIGHYLKAMYFEAEEGQPKNDRALPYNDQYNIVFDLLGRVSVSKPGEIEGDYRFIEPGQFEVTLNFVSFSACSEVGKDTAVFNSQLVYAGLFRIKGEMDLAQRENCVRILIPHMKSAADAFMSFSGIPLRPTW